MDTSEQYFTFKGITIWFIAAFFFLYEFLLRTILGTFHFEIMNDLGISSVEFAILSSSSYLLVYSLMQIPAGICVDKFGLKKSLLAGAVICVLSTWGFVYVESFAISLILRVFTALGSSFGLICLLYTVYEWLPRKYSTFLIGASQFIGTMGPVIAAGPISMMANSAGNSWRDVYFGLFIAGFILCVAILFFVSDKVNKQGKYIILAPKANIFSVIYKRILTKTQPWLIAMFGAFVYFSLEYLSENDGIIFIMLKGHKETFASFAISSAWLGYAIGSPIFGYISDTLQRRTFPMRIAGLLYAVGITIVIYLDRDITILAGFLLIGISSGAISITYANMAEQFEHRNLALALSFNNTIICLFGAVIAPLFGFIIDKYTIGGKTIDNLVIYQTTFSTFIIFGIIAFILSLFIKESFCKSNIEYTYLR